MKYEKLGKYIHLIDEKNTNFEIKEVLGINIHKEFMPSVANVSQTDLSRYKIIRKGQFAYSAMQVGRDETIRIALYKKDKPSIISPAYQVISVNNLEEIFPEYIMLYFQKAEADRYGWFISDGSVRASLDFERLCEIEIPYIPIEDQKKYVEVYNALQKNQKSYADSLEDLQFICDNFIDKYKLSNAKVKIGSCVEVIDYRNKDYTYNNVLGINVHKEFMSSKANLTSTDLSTYKIISKNQFAYSSMQVGRDETVRVVLYDKEKPAIISPAYSVFQVTNKELMPEFLMLWFFRAEFNRYGWFISDGSVRASLDWERFCEIEIPLPSNKEQEAIISIYKILETRKRLNKELKESLKPLCPILMKDVYDKINRN